MQRFDGQGKNLVSPLAQGRDLDADDTEPVEQVGAHQAGGGEVFETTVGRGQNAHVGGAGQHLADAVHLAGFEKSQQLGLAVGRHVANLVEQHRAAVGAANDADRAVDGASERALAMAEQLRFDHLPAHRRAVEPHKARALPPGPLVNPPREPFLADAGFAEQQHGHFRVGDTPRDVQDGAHAGHRD